MSTALSAYRQLLRCINTAFRGDAFMLAGARGEIRCKFKEAANLTDSAALQQKLAEGREAIDFISQNVVQAKLNDRGNFAMQVEKQHVDAVAEEAALRPDRGIG